MCGAVRPISQCTNAHLQCCKWWGARHRRRVGSEAEHLSWRVWATLRDWWWAIKKGNRKFYFACIVRCIGLWPRNKRNKKIKRIKRREGKQKPEKSRKWEHLTLCYTSRTWVQVFHTELISSIPYAHAYQVKDTFWGVRATLREWRWALEKGYRKFNINAHARQVKDTFWGVRATLREWWWAIKKGNKKFNTICIRAPVKGHILVC